MGWIKDSKAEMMRAQAEKARTEGRQVVAFMLNWPSTKGDISGEVVDWSMMIAAVESEGWQLDKFSGATDRKGRPEAYCLFRLDPARQEARAADTATIVSQRP